MLRRILAGAIAVAVVISGVGCDQALRDNWNDFWNISDAPADTAAAPMPDDGVSVVELAGALKMRIVASDAVSATLADDRNMVTLTPDPGAAVLVNGRRIRWQGQIGVLGTRLVVPATLAGEVRPYLLRSRRAAATPPKVDGVDIIEVRGEPRPRLGVVVLDPGHGGKDPGGVRTYRTSRGLVDIRDKDIALSISLEVAEQLRRRNVDVRMTRNNDTFVSHERRVADANAPGVKLMVSIHANTHKDPNTAGLIVFLGRRPYDTSVKAADAILNSVRAAKILNLGVRNHPRPIRVINLPRNPSVLVEVGFLSNPTEAMNLMRPEYRGRVAAAIAEGIYAYLQANTQPR